jgi:RNA recognition motif-containing protein
MPTNCVWLDGISESVSEKFLARQFNRFGHVSQSVIDRDTCRGLVYFDSVEVAQRAVSEMRGRAIGGKKIQVGGLPSAAASLSL